MSNSVQRGNGCVSEDEEEDIEEDFLPFLGGAHIYMDRLIRSPQVEE